MKRGFEYLASEDKVRVDRAMCSVLAPFVKTTGLLVAGYVSKSQYPDLTTVFDQPRIGKGGSVFPIHKFVTLDPVTKEPLCPAAARIRRFGLDELAQIGNIREGNMHFTGWRPTIPRHYEEFRELLDPPLRARHDRLVSLFNPGILSSFGLWLHQHHGYEMGQDSDSMNDPDGAQMRAEMNIKDAVDASFVNDLKLMESLVSFAVLSRLGKKHSDEVATV